MPELPEVETIKRGLLKFIVKKKLVSTEILCEKSLLVSQQKAWYQELEDLERLW